MKRSENRKEQTVGLQKAALQKIDSAMVGPQKTHEQLVDELTTIMIEATGTQHSDVADRIINQVINAQVCPRPRDGDHLTKAISMIREMAPQNVTEAMLAVQMIATNDAALMFLGRATTEGQSLAGAEASVLSATRLMRLHLESLVYEKGLPASLDCERFVLGSVMLNDGLFAEVAAMLPAEAFSIEKHRRIFTRMTELAKRDERIDRLTVANELIVQGQIESIDGMGYLVSLDEGIPELPNIESYTRIIREKYDKRRAIFACQRAINQLLIGADETPGVIESLDKTLLDIRAGEDQKHSFRPVFESREFLEARGVF